MNIKKISVKVIIAYSLMMIMFLSPLIIINQASQSSVLTVIILVVAYIVGELYLWKRKMGEEEKEWLHVGLINIALSVTFLILAIVFFKYGYGPKGSLPSILFLAVYCLSGTLFTVLYIKQTRSNKMGRKKAAKAGTGAVIGGVIGIGGAKIFLHDASQSVMILILIFIGCVLSIAFLMMALSLFCKYILKTKEITD